MNDDEDPDWEAEAKAGEAEEKRVEFWKRATECMARNQKLKPLSIRSLPRGTRLIVTFFEEDEDPLASGPMEFTIVDPASCKVLVKDKRHFPAPTEGTLLGCEHFTTPPYQRVFQEGKLEHSWWLNYEVGGKTFDRDSIPQTLKGIKLILISGQEYDLWKLE